MGKGLNLLIMPATLPIEFLAEELKTKIPEIDFAFLFGSYANGTQRPDFELDIAIYFFC